MLRYTKIVLVLILSLMALCSHAQDYQAKFDKLMQEGDALMINQDYDGAIRKFEAAEDIFPENDTLVKKLAAARKKRDENTRNEVRKQYEKVIEVADQFFDKKDYDQAKVYYARAVKLSMDGYPKSKLQEIERILNPNKASSASTTTTSKVDMAGDAGRENRVKSVDELKDEIYNNQNSRMMDSKSVSEGWYEGFTDLSSFTGPDHNPNRTEVEGVKNAIENQTMRSQEIAEQKRNNQKQTLDGLQKKQSDDEPVRSVREEKSTRENRNGDVIETTLKRFITINGKETEYKMVTTRYGTYYFKNSVSISESVWDREAEL